MKLGAFFLALQQTTVEAKSAKPWRVYHSQKQSAKRTTLTAADNNRILRQQKKAYEDDTSEDKIVILDWWGGTPTRKRITKHECPETACYVTNDRSSKNKRRESSLTTLDISNITDKTIQIWRTEIRINTGFSGHEKPLRRESMLAEESCKALGTLDST